MEKRIRLILAAFMFALAIAVPISYSVGANTQSGEAVAGSRQDPLVTASYVSQYVAQHGSDTSFKVVQLTYEQRIRARSGSIELIVRSGRTRVTTQHIDRGVINLTSAQEHFASEPVPTNNLLLIPRADRRGLVVLSDHAYILVRGDYEIE